VILSVLDELWTCLWLGIVDMLFCFIQVVGKTCVRTVYFRFRLTLSCLNTKISVGISSKLSWMVLWTGAR